MNDNAAMNGMHHGCTRLTIYMGHVGVGIIFLYFLSIIPPNRLVAFPSVHTTSPYHHCHPIYSTAIYLINAPTAAPDKPRDRKLILKKPNQSSGQIRLTDQTNAQIRSGKRYDTMPEAIPTEIKSPLTFAGAGLLGMRTRPFPGAWILIWADCGKEQMGESFSVGSHDASTRPTVTVSNLWPCGLSNEKR